MRRNKESVEWIAPRVEDTSNSWVDLSDVMPSGWEGDCHGCKKKGNWLITKDYRAHCINCGFTVPCEIRPIGNIPFIVMCGGVITSGLQIVLMSEAHNKM